MINTSTEDTQKEYYCLEIDRENTMKSFMNFDSIVSELKNPSEFNKASVVVNEENKKEADAFLLNHNYYAFSIYKKTLPVRDNQIFDFRDCVEVYEFDSFLRNSLQKFTGYIENLVKASIINSLCSNYSGELQKAQCYLDPFIYKNEEIAEDTIRHFGRRAFISNQALTIKHHIDNRNGHIPLWVILPELTFGETTHFIESLKDEYREMWISDLFLKNSYYNGVKGLDQHIKNVAHSWITASWALRNRCAHYSRVYGLNFNIGNPRFYTVTLRELKDTNKKKSDNRDLFAFMLAIKNVLICHDNSIQLEWNAFIDSIKEKLDNSEIVLPYKMGFPEGYIKYLKIDL